MQQLTLFDYGSLDEPTRIIVQELDAELDAVLKRTAKEIGLILLKAKERLPHGMYMSWVASKGLSETTAWRCMQVAQGKEVKSFKMKDLDVEVMEPPVEPIEDVDVVRLNRITNEDKRQAVENFFSEFPQLAALSNREVAKRCGVDEKLVRKIRKELFPDPEIESKPKSVSVSTEAIPEQETEQIETIIEKPQQSKIEIKEAKAPESEAIETTVHVPIEANLDPEPQKLLKVEVSEEVQREREIRRQQIQERNEQLKEKGVDLPVGKYSCLIVDPPWTMQKIEREERPNQFEFDYPTMTEEELKVFPLPDFAANDCHLYLWTTQKHLPLALRLAEHWGFKYQCLMTWVKNVGMTPFSWMYSTEHALFCTKGSLPLLTIGRRLDFSAKVREHSRKPDEFYNLVKDVSPGPRLDIFSREKREGFDQYGNEVEKYAAK